MKRFLACLLAALMLIAPVGALAANVVKAGEDFYYLDQANVLSEATEGEIYFANQLLAEACGAQIVIAALNDIGRADIADYAADMGDDWGIGDASEQNGFLLLMTISDENYYAITGRGLYGIFPASTLNQLFDRYLETDFAKGDYDAGARKFFEAVYERIADYYNLTITPQDGVEAYQAYLNSGEAASGFGGAIGGGARGGWYEDYDDYDYYYDDVRASLLEPIVTILVLLLLIMLVSRVRGGAFWFWRPTFIWPFFGSIRGPYHHHHGPGPGPGPRRRPPGSFGGFSSGGFRSGSSRSSFGGGRSFGGNRGGFGGARGGGGRGFGGGAGRGRH